MNNINDMGLPPNQPSQATIAAALSSAPYLECKTKDCGGRMFLPAVSFKRISNIALGTDQPMLVPIELSVCARCGTVLADLVPEQFKGDF